MTLRRIHPDPGTVTADDAVASLRLGERARPERPYVVANMVVTADGRATVGGRSGPIGRAADHALFHDLRDHADAVLAGTGTLRTERYGRLVREPERRAARAARGLRPDPLACVVTLSGQLPLDIPLLAEPEGPVAVYSRARVNLEEACGRVTVRQVASGDVLAAALRSLRRDEGVRFLLCEGGPTLLRALVEAEAVDELFLTVAPMLAAGEPALTAVSGPALPDPVELELCSVLECDGELLLRYGIGG